ncbi:MAG: ROK family protein [Victivallales bacterium]|nr:ROK family protein [Victivallales bacterium]
MGSLKLGIDLGGTKILTLLIDEDSKVVSRAKTKTSKDRDFDSITMQMKEMSEKALSDAGALWKDVAGVGIAVPSPVDHATGTIVNSPNLGLKDIQAIPIFERLFSKKIALGNDTTCGIWSEYKAGAAKGTGTAVGFFPGTGLGGGIVVNGKLQTGIKGVAAELGHMIIRYKGRRCGCGNRGCLEAYCSKVAFSKRFDKLINKRLNKSVLTELMGKDFSTLKSSVLAKAYRSGDQITCMVLNKGAYMLGVATASMACVLAPDCFVYGGGVMEALGEELLPHIRTGLNEHLFGLQPQDVKLKLSMFGDDAVALGAALLLEDCGEI